METDLRLFHFQEGQQTVPTTNWSGTIWAALYVSLSRFSNEDHLTLDHD